MRRSLLLGAAAAGVSTAAAAVAVVVAARRFLAREYARPDPAAGDDFSIPPDVRHVTVTSHDGAALHLLDRGRPDAPPLLFVHGVTLAADVWWYQLHDLAEDFRVLALDQRGHGQSAVGTDGYGLHLLGRDLATVLGGLDLRGAVIVGHSMGGFAAQRFCIDHPDVLAERVAGIVLVNTACGALLGPRGEWLLPLAKRVVQAGGRRPSRVNLDAAYLGARVPFGREPSPTHVRFTYELADAMSPEATVASVSGFLDMDMAADLERVRVPALVVTGSQDRLTPPRQSRRIVNHLPGARLVVLEGCGHMSMLERHEELDRLIADFATEVKWRAGHRPAALTGTQRTWQASQA